MRIIAGGKVAQMIQDKFVQQKAVQGRRRW